MSESAMRASRSAAVLLTVGLLACGDSTASAPPPPQQLGVPVILANELSIDSVARVVRRRVVAHDPDGPVRIGCTGAIRGLGFDSLVLAVPFALVRRMLFLDSYCTASQSDSSAYANVSIDGLYPLDSPPTTVPLQIPAEIHVGVPTQWAIGIRDDWAIDTFWFDTTRNDPATSCTDWADVGRWTGNGRTRIDTIITVTFSQVGPYCAGYAAKDDIGEYGHFSSKSAFFNVLP
jgi:hypothetical protein